MRHCDMRTDLCKIWKEILAIFRFFQYNKLIQFNFLARGFCYVFKIFGGAGL